MKNRNYTLPVLITLFILLSAQCLIGQTRRDSTSSETGTWRYIEPAEKAKKMNKVSDSSYRNIRIKELEETHKKYVYDQRQKLQEFVRKRTERFDQEKKNLSDPASIKSLEAAFEADKKAFAKETAKRIQAHKDVIDSQIAFWRVRDDDDKEQSYIGINLERGLEIKLGDDKKYRRLVKTESGFTFAFGYTFGIGDGLDINDFSYGNNNYFGIGYQWRTPISTNQKWRFNFGLLYQSYGVELNGGRIFSPNTSETQIVNFQLPSKKRKFRQDQLVIPLQLEFGGNTKREYSDGRIRYDRSRKWKAGIGGYAGINLSSRLKLKYENNGRDIKETSVNSFDTNILTYGVDAYVGWSIFNFYTRMSLSPIFKSGSVDAQYVSFGLRLQR